MVGESGLVGGVAVLFGGGVPLAFESAAAKADTPGPGNEDVVSTPARGSTTSGLSFVPGYTKEFPFGVDGWRTSDVLLYDEGTGDSANLAVEAALEGLRPYERSRLDPADDPNRPFLGTG